MGNVFNGYIDKVVGIQDMVQELGFGFVSFGEVFRFILKFIEVVQEGFFGVGFV